MSDPKQIFLQPKCCASEDCEDGRQWVRYILDEESTRSPGCYVVKSDKLTRGCVVFMKAESGMKGYGNPQCVSRYCEPLGEVSLYGHNQCYKDYDIARIVEYPLLEADT